MNPSDFRPWHALAILVVAALPAANTLSPAVEHDTWWHLRVGQLVAETGTVPDTDPFSRMSRETPAAWRAYSWLYEWGLYQVFAASGLGGVMWLRSALSAASVAAVLAFWFRRAGFSPWAVLLAAPVAVAVMPLTTERPWHFTIVFATATAWAVTAVREGVPVRRVVWLPLVYAVWANIHIQFVLGWGVLGLACLFPGRANRAAVVGLAAGCFAATLANPYHAGLLEVIWEYATQGAPLKLVHELSAPNPFGDSSAGLWAAAGLIVFARAASGVAARRPIDWFEVGFLAAAAVLAVRMNRDIWFLIVASAAAMRPAGPGRVAGWVVPVLVAAAFLGVRLANTAGFMRSTDYEEGQAAKYPVRAVEHILSERLPGPVYNDFDWGGYLIWAAPGYPVSIDGRTNLYGNERMMRSFETWSSEAGWEADPDFRASRVVLAPKNRVLTRVLHDQPDRWRVAYEDDLAVVFARRTGPE